MAPDSIPLPPDPITPLVEAYWVDLDRAAAADLPRWRAMLSAEELDRARAFRFARDGHRFMARRGILRLLLARRIERSPAALRFTAGRYGKPRLAGGGCEFNISHSRGLGLFALAEGIAVGCDVEFHDSALLAESIPERFFSSRELAELRATPPTQQTTAFFDGWTRKEALLKACGLGLAVRLDGFDVSLAPGERPALYGGGAGWSAHSVAHGPDCSATVVAAGAWHIAVRALDPVALLKHDCGPQDAAAFA